MGARFIRALLAAAGILGGSLTAPDARAGSIRILMTGSVVFADADPDLAPVLGPETVSLDIEALGKPGQPWAVTMLADSDLHSAGDVIPASSVYWKAFPNPPFHDGVLSTTMPKLVGMGFTHTQATVTLSFFMKNSWTFPTGSYTGSVTLTISSP